MVTGAPGVAVIGGDPPWSCRDGPPPGGVNRCLEKGNAVLLGMLPGIVRVGCEDGATDDADDAAAARRRGGGAMSLTGVQAGTLSRAETVLAALDDEQRAAAQAVTGPVCILAGAGTGKTRTI